MPLSINNHKQQLDNVKVQMMECTVMHMLNLTSGHEVDKKNISVVLFDCCSYLF